LNEKIELLRWEDFSETYQFQLENLYDIYDSSQASGSPANWIYEKSGLNGHADAIT